MMEMELIRQDDFEFMQKMSKAMIASAFFQVQGGTDSAQAVAQVVVKLMAGRELGIQPVAAMMGVNVIQGRVSLSAQLMLACAKRAGYTYEVHEADGWCRIEWMRGDKKLGEAGFTIEEAKAAGLVKPGGNWTKYPSDMLFWRAVSRGVRRFCPDATSGMAVYAPDELGVEVDPEDSQPTPPQGSKAEQAEVMRAKLIEAGVSEDDAAKEAAKFTAPKGNKSKPGRLKIVDDDVPPILRPEPSDAELDALFAKQEKV